MGQGEGVEGIERGICTGGGGGLHLGGLEMVMGRELRERALTRQREREIQIDWVLIW